MKIPRLVRTVLACAAILAAGLLAIRAAMPLAQTNVAYVSLLSALSTSESVYLTGIVPETRAGSLQKPSALFTQAVTSNPKSVSDLYGLGLAAFRARDYRNATRALAALNDARESIALPIRLLAQYRLGELDKIPSSTRLRYAYQFSELAYRWVNGGRRAEGLLLYELSTALAPQELSIWLARIDAYANDWDAVKDSHERAEALFPGDPYLKAVKAFYELYGARDASAARLAADAALRELTEPRDLSQAQIKWLYNLYVVEADLSNSDIGEAARWYRRAAGLPVSSYFQNLAASRADQLVPKTGASDSVPEQGDN